MKLSKQNIEYLETFEKMLNSQPPYGEEFEGDIIEWIDSVIKKESNYQVKKMMLNHFLQYSIKIILEYFKGNEISTSNKLNAEKVVEYANKKEIGLLKIDKDKFDDAQLITLFRILTKDLNIFKNSQEDVKNILCDIFGFGYDNVEKYFQNKNYKWKAKKLFKQEWKDLI